MRRSISLIALPYRMPVKLPANVIFGGPKLEELYVTSIDPKLLGRESDGGGALFRITGLGARGIAELRYAG